MLDVRGGSSWGIRQDQVIVVVLLVTGGDTHHLHLFIDYSGRGTGQAGQVVGGGRCPEGVDGVGCWQGEKWQWRRFLKVVVP